MNAVEDRVRAAMTAAAHLAAQEVPDAPPLRLPASPVPSSRRQRPRRWTSWAAPLTAAAAVLALAVSLVLAQGNPGGTARPASPAPSGPGGVPRYYAALSSNGVLVGDWVAGRVVENFPAPRPKGLITIFESVAAASDAREFVVTAATYPASVIKPANGIATATGTMSWYALRLTPKAAHPASLSLLPVKPLTIHGSSQLTGTTAALSASGSELAVTGFTAKGSLEVRVYSAATGRLQHTWSASDPALTLPRGSAGGLDAGMISLTWVGGEGRLALGTGVWGKVNENYLIDTVRELNAATPSGSDLVADGKVVWNVPAVGSSPDSLLQACSIGNWAQRISADGTTLGCAALTGPGTDPNLSFVTYPLGAGAATAGKAAVQYQVPHTGQQGVSTQRLLWVSPSGREVVGAWTTYQKHTVEDAPDGLHIGVMSDGKFTPLKFPAGFDRVASIASITW